MGAKLTAAAILYKQEINTKEGNTMFYAKYKNESGNIENRLYFDHGSYIKDTFNPECETLTTINFALSGYGYKKKKEAARNIAVEWSNIGDVSGLSWFDICHISEWFSTIGKRFGLLSEFRENGLC